MSSSFSGWSLVYVAAHRNFRAALDKVCSQFDFDCCHRVGSVAGVQQTGVKFTRAPGSCLVFCPMGQAVVLSQAAW